MLAAGEAAHHGMPTPFEVPDAEKIIGEVLEAGRRGMIEGAHFAPEGRSGLLPAGVRGWEVNPFRPWEVLDIRGPRGRQEFFDIGSRVEFKPSRTNVTTVQGSSLPLGHARGVPPEHEYFYLAQMVDGSWRPSYGSPYAIPKGDPLPSRLYTPAHGDIEEWGREAGTQLSMKDKPTLRMGPAEPEVRETWRLSEDGPKHLKNLERELTSKRGSGLVKEDANTLDVLIQQEAELKIELERALEGQGLDDQTKAVLREALETGDVSHYQQNLELEMQDYIPWREGQIEELMLLRQNRERLLAKSTNSHDYEIAVRKVKSGKPLTVREDLALKSESSRGTLVRKT